MCWISIVTCACTNIWPYHSTQNLENINFKALYMTSIEAASPGKIMAVRTSIAGTMAQSAAIGT